MRAALRTSVWLRMSPCSITQERAMKYSGVTPVICVLQLLAPSITCALPDETGADATINGNLPMASASLMVTVGADPEPPRNPPADVEPDMTMNRLLPMDCTERLTLCFAPSPIASISTTAETPIIMPSMVSAVRMRFAPRARQASPRFANGFIGASPARREPRHRP